MFMFKNKILILIVAFLALGMLAAVIFRVAAPFQEEQECLHLWQKAEHTVIDDVHHQTVRSCRLCGKVLSESEIKHEMKKKMIEPTAEQIAKYDGVVSMESLQCVSCGLVESQRPVILNIDFETNAYELLDYVNTLDGVSPYARDERCSLYGHIEKGIWVNDASANGQVIINEELGLRDREVFTIACDIKLGSNSYASDFLLDWGATQPTADGVTRYFYNLKIDAEGKMNIYKHFVHNAEESANLSGYTFTRPAWYHLEITVNVETQQLTIWAGQYETDANSALLDYSLVGQTKNFAFGGTPDCTVPCFRLSTGAGLAALDNFVVIIPTD